MINNRAVLVRIANTKPSELREIIYVNDSVFTRRSQVGRLYRTKGDLIAAVFNLHLDGILIPQNHDTRLSSEPEAGVP